MGAITNWIQAAIKEAMRQGVSPDIVLATIEAETNGKNVMGDNGRAFGYGQVWLKWHYDDLKTVANQMQIPIPAAPTNEKQEEQFKALILNNDELSMALAVKTIKDFWDGAGHNWDKFTKSYVGAGISAESVARRKAIWNKYKGNSDQGDIVGTIQASEMVNMGVEDIKSLTSHMSGEDMAKYAAVGIASAVLLALIAGK